MYLPFWQESLPKIILEFAKYCIMNRRERKSRGTILQTNWIWTNNLVLFFSLSLHTQESHKITITARVETHIHVVGKGQSWRTINFIFPPMETLVIISPPPPPAFTSSREGGGVYQREFIPLIYHRSIVFSVHVTRKPCDCFIWTNGLTKRLLFLSSLSVVKVTKSKPRGLQ